MLLCVVNGVSVGDFGWWFVLRRKLCNMEEFPLRSGNVHGFGVFVMSFDWLGWVSFEWLGGLVWKDLCEMVGCDFGEAWK